MSTTNELSITNIAVPIIYVLSGVSQPLLMTYIKEAGLGDPKCQVYMLFYYLGPSLVIFPIMYEFGFNNSNKTNSSIEISAILKIIGIALIDLFAQAMNYTGSILAGPEIFAIIYSSVTIWAAVYSRILLDRHMNIQQWLGVILVFLGLIITAFGASVNLGANVFHGCCLILIGSSMHALVYVLSESIMKVGEKVEVKFICAIQGIVSCSSFLLWQALYTRNHFDALILQPMHKANTSPTYAIMILSTFSLVNFIHYLAFYNTLKYFPGGATSAGVMKGLQAVLVFVATFLLFCGKVGGDEMCFTMWKFLSLIIVVVGIYIYGSGTPTAIDHDEYEVILDAKVKGIDSGASLNTCDTSIISLDTL